MRDVGDKELRNRKQSILGNLAMDEQTIEEYVARKLLEYFTDEKSDGREIRKPAAKRQGALAWRRSGCD